jgi:hypothetical protein
VIGHGGRQMGNRNASIGAGGPGLAAGVALLLVCALAGAQQPSSDEAQLEALRSEIIQMIADAPCVNVVHCRVLALGSRPCGGPDEYLAYSSHTPNKTVLENKALEYTLIQEDVQRARSVAGVCTVLPKPQLACIDQRCRVVGSP